MKEKKKKCHKTRIANKDWKRHQAIMTFKNKRLCDNCLWGFSSTEHSPSFFPWYISSLALQYCVSVLTDSKVYTCCENVLSKLHASIGIVLWYHRKCPDLVYYFKLLYYAIIRNIKGQVKNLLKYLLWIILQTNVDIKSRSKKFKWLFI